MERVLRRRLDHLGGTRCRILERETNLYWILMLVGSRDRLESVGASDLIPSENAIASFQLANRSETFGCCNRRRFREAATARKYATSLSGEPLADRTLPHPSAGRMQYLAANGARHSVDGKPTCAEFSIQQLFRPAVNSSAGCPRYEGPCIQG